MSVSVVIVAYRGRPHLERCLASIEPQWPFEVIVVDNDSRDGTAEWVKETHPRARLIVSDENRGYAGGNNLGISRARGDFIFILNNDTELPDGFFDRLEGQLAGAPPDAGMFALRILFWDGQRVDSLGSRFIAPGLAKDITRSKHLRFLRGPCGAAAIYRRELLEACRDENGYFDERFFMYSEDVDLAWRAERLGFRCIHLPITVLHRHGASTRDDERIRDPFLYLSIRNRILSFRKNNDRRVLAVPFLLLQVLIWFRYVFQRKGRIALRAIRDGYRGVVLSPEEVLSSY